jgi:hypothetical protein
MRRYNGTARIFFVLGSIVVALWLLSFMRAALDRYTFLFVALLAMSTAQTAHSLGDTTPPPTRDRRAIAAGVVALLLLAVSAVRLALGHDVLQLDASEVARLADAAPGRVAFVDALSQSTFDTWHTADAALDLPVHVRFAPMLPFVAAVTLLLHVGSSFAQPYFPRVPGERRHTPHLALGLLVIVAPAVVAALAISEGLAWCYLHASWMLAGLAALALASVLMARRFDRPPNPLPVATARR